MHQLVKVAVVVVWENEQRGEITTASALLLTHQELHGSLLQGLLDQPFPFSRENEGDCG